jgi:excisionase family DNA binding protein
MISIKKTDINLVFLVCVADRDFLLGAGLETYLSIEGLAKYLGIAEKTVRKWVLNHDIPYHKIMKIIRFRVFEIEQWIETSGKNPQGNDGEEQDGDLFAEDETRNDRNGEDEKDNETAGTKGVV